MTIGINGSNLANSMVYSSQAKTIQSTEFARYNGFLTKTYSATIQNSHLEAGKKIDVWQYVPAVSMFQPVDRYEYDFVYYTPAVFGNTTISAVLHKNDCGVGYTSDPFTYTVPANKYTASTQAAADALAQNEIATQGQVAANAALTCILECTGGPWSPEPIQGRATIYGSSVYQYSITPVAGVQSYTWSVNRKQAQIISGQGTSSIEIRTIAISDDTYSFSVPLTVTATDLCGVTGQTTKTIVLKGGSGPIE